MIPSFKAKEKRYITEGTICE